MEREKEIIKKAVQYASDCVGEEQKYRAIISMAFQYGAEWADSHPRKVYVVVRCEEHDDYVEKVFVDKTKANEYCNKFEGNPNEYGRYYEEMEVTL